MTHCFWLPGNGTCPRSELKPPWFNPSSDTNSHAWMYLSARRVARVY